MLNGHFWRQERSLVIVSLALCVTGVLMKAAIWLRGSAMVPPEGDLSRAVSFDLAVGTFFLTTALILPIAPLSAKARRVLRHVMLTFCAYGLVIENVQHARGLDPRFSSYGGAIDTVTGILFGVLALLIVIAFAYLSFRFIRRENASQCPSILRLGTLYGLLTTAMGLASGVWMSAIQGRMFADAANIIWLHGFGFHGIQAVPLIAWSLVGSQAQAVRLVHIGGWAWTACIACVGLQTLLGRHLYAWELLPVLSVIAAMVWLGVACVAVLDYSRRAWRRKLALPERSLD